MPQPQLTKDERYCITYLHMAGFKDAEIARRLGRHRGTIGRELARNRDAFSGYHDDSAQRLADERRSLASRRYKLDTSRLGQAVRRDLRERWPPEQIAGKRLKGFLDAMASRYRGVSRSRAMLISFSSRTGLSR